MNLWRTVWCRVVGINFLALALTSGRTAEMTSSNSEPLNILLIYSGNVFVPASMLQDQPLRAAITASAGRMVNFHLENLPEYNLTAIDYDREMADLIFHKHRLHPPDLIIAGGAAALNFLDRHRENLWPEKPAMFYSVLGSLVRNRKMPVNVTGRTISFDPGGTIGLALKLHPATARLVVLTGADQAGWSWLPGIREHLRAQHPALATTYLTNQTVEEMSTSLAALSRSDVVLYTGVGKDAAGRRCDTLDVFARLEESSGAPIYALGEHYLGRGVVGGVIPSFAEQGRQAGILALRLLAGEAPSSIPVEPGSAPVPMVDWHQLKRWKISESLLPPGTVIVNRDPTLWEQHRKKVIGALLVLALQTAIIVVLFVERLRRRQAEARMILATSAASVGVWEWDIVRDEIWVTDAIRSRLGLRESEHPNLDRFFHSLHSDDREATRRIVRETLEAGKDFQAEYRTISASGEVRWIASRGQVERGTNGKPLRMRGVSVDVTTQKEAEELHRELAHVSRVGMLGELTSALAHELNQPLAAILSNAQAARRFLAAGTTDPAELRAILDDIVSDDKRAGEVIHRLRAMVRKEPAPCERCSLNDVVREVLQILNSELIAQNVITRLELEEALPPVEAGRVEIQQVLINLVLNAARAMKDTPPDRRTLTLQTCCSDGNLILTIRDRGHGIPEDVLPHIFDPFFTTNGSGLGMGLAICRRLLEAHGGWIQAKNRPEGGARFTVSIPLQNRKGDANRG